MAYIGQNPDHGTFEKQALTADGSTTTFTLNYSVGSSSAILVSVSGVIQEPESAYNISGGGTNIVFSEAPASGETVFIVFLGISFDAGVFLGTGTITVQTATTESAAADLFLTYDDSASALRKITNTNLTGDGSTTAFTIGTSGRTQNDLLITVNGIVFHPGDDYTSSGTTVTFTVAPDAGAEIRVRYLPI